eukprot:6204996-Pleurochrysis_carterae.AAC.1
MGCPTRLLQSLRPRPGVRGVNGARRQRVGKQPRVLVEVGRFGVGGGLFDELVDADDGGVGRDGARDDGRGADGGAVANLNVAEHRAARAEHAAVAHGRVALQIAHWLPSRAKRHLARGTRMTHGVKGRERSDGWGGGGGGEQLAYARAAT